MSGTSESLQRASSGPLVPQTLAAIFGGEPPFAEGLTEAIRRLSVLVEVADTVTQRLSLDHQLPRLIELIVEALDAERATLFLHDVDAGELLSREARGDGVAEIRIPQNVGIAGAIFGSGVAEIIDDAYRDPRFNAEVDRRTGYRTRSLLCVPLRNRADQIIGVTQVLNKRSGVFTAVDMALLEAISRHAASALEQAQMKERLEQAQMKERLEQARRESWSFGDHRGDLDRAARRHPARPYRRGGDPVARCRALDTFRL
jgi:adenylate cyclase